MRRNLLAGPALVAAMFAAISAWGQAPAVVEAGTIAAIPTALLGEALTVSIAASVGRPSEEPSWQARDLKYTIPGSSVSIKMIGSDVAIVITVTPYSDKAGGLLLVAQGQVWYKEGDAGLRYRTTVDTLSVKFGERVLFYPFGSQVDGGSPLRVELVMDRYRPEPSLPTTQETRDKDQAQP